MVFPHPEGVFGDAPGTEPFLVPLAIPLIAGPSAIATVMLMVSRNPSQRLAWVVALTAAMAVATIVLVAAYRKLGMDDLATDSQRVLAETYESPIPSQANADELRPAPEPTHLRPPSDNPT